jgi:hypothetical protein
LLRINELGFLKSEKSELFWSIFVGI